MTIYIAYHKKYPKPTNDPIYCPLHVGKSISGHDLGFAGDDSGDHISDKNAFFSELTGLYWIWKNTDHEIVGLCHYRRFFLNRQTKFGILLEKSKDIFLNWNLTERLHRYSNLILSGTQATDLLKEYDVILPKPKQLKYSVQVNYKRRHFSKDLDETRLVIQQLFPDYLDAFDFVLNKKQLFPCNMFVMKRKNFNAYMEWLFAILLELEQRIDTIHYDSYQKRIFGFISERLLDVWITKNNLKTVCLQIKLIK